MIDPAAGASYPGRRSPRQAGAAHVVERPTPRRVGGLSLGLLLGVAAGWLAGLLRAPKAKP